MPDGPWAAYQNEDDLDAHFNGAGKQYGVDPDLLRSVAHVESSGNPRAVSPQGAQGLMQIVPDTARELGVTDPFIPRQSIYGAARYLRENFDRFGRPDLAVAAYHGGPGVNAWGPKTADYVDKVSGAYAARKANAPAEPEQVAGAAGPWTRYQQPAAGPWTRYQKDEGRPLTSKQAVKQLPMAKPDEAAPASKEDPTGAAADMGWTPPVPTPPSGPSGPSAPPPSGNFDVPGPDLTQPVTPAPIMGGAGARIAGAAQEGWQSGSQVLTEMGQKLADKYGLGGDARALGVILGGMNAALRGAQQTAYEIGNSLGGPALGRDLAGMAEAFPAGGAELGAGIGAMGMHPAPGPAEVPASGVAEVARPAEAPRPRPEQVALEELGNIASGKPAPEALPTLEAMAAEAKPPEIAPAPEAPAPEATALEAKPPEATPPVVPPEPPPVVPESQQVPVAQPAAQAAPPMERPPPRPVDAVTALIDAGGVRDTTGDLKAIGADAVHHRAAGRLINNRSGLTPDYAREFLVDRGYLPQDADINSVYDLIGDHVAGRPTFTAADAAEAEAWRQGQSAYGEQDRHADALAQVGTVASDAGVRLTPQEAEHATKLVAQGYHPEAAVYNALRSSQDMHGPMFARRVPLYSAVGRAVDALPQERGTGAQMLAMLNKTAGVKPEEMRWTGLDEWLKGQGHVTKAAMQDYLRANSLDVQEVTRGTPQDATIRREVEALGIPWEEASVGRIEAAGGSTELAERFWQAIGGGPAAPRYAGYQLPGGENYRELLITLPTKTKLPEPLSQLPEGYEHSINSANPPERRWTVIPPGQLHGRPYAGAHPTREAATEAALRQLNAERMSNAESQSHAGDYRSPHWDEPNVLAHVRFNERTAPDGKRVLLVEEVQSDWHQAGRKNGYQGTIKELPPGYKVIKFPNGEFLVRHPDGHDLTSAGFPTHAEAVAYAINRLNGGAYKSVPDAPFKTTWPQLAMKRIIKFATDNGFDRVAWAPGDVQAARYDLSKQVDHLNWIPSTGELHAYKGGQQILTRSGVQAKDLPDLVGKEVAERLVNAPDSAGVDEAKTPYKRLEGNDLKVGGEGMRGFYDKILPNEVQKIVGKYGAKVGRSDVDAGQYKVMRDSHSPPYRLERSGSPDIISRHPTADAAWAEAERLGAQQVHSIDITPQLRQAVQTEGLPLFSKNARGAAPEGTPSHAAVQAAVDATSQMLGHRAGIEVVDAGTDGFKIRTPQGQEFTADGIAVGRLIRVALSPDKTFDFLNHEAMHVLRNMGVFSPAEWKILENTADRQGWVKRYGIDRTYGDSDMPHAKMLEEAISEHFAQVMRGEAPATPFVARMMDKLRELFERMRNALAGHGFQSANDVFGAVRSGEIGAREPGSGMPQRGPLDLDEAAQMADDYRAGRRAPMPPQRGAPLLGEEAAAERPRATPEPTIRNDERQIGLPGMEPSARQAQAARDQAGPKGGQKAADEGLFAPKGGEQDSMFARRPQLNVTTPQTEVLRDKKGIERAVREFRVGFAPTAVPGAKPMEYTLRKYGAEKTRAYDQSFDALEKVRTAMDRVSKEEQVDFTDRMERGEAQPTPELTRLAGAMRQELDNWAKKVQGLGRGYLANAIEDYMGHIWGNYAEWAARLPADASQTEMEQAARAQGQARRPLRGSGSFLKQRSFPTQKEGIEAGLVPVTYNPVDLQLIKLHEMQKFYHGTKLADDMKQTGLARWVPLSESHDAEMSGMVKLNDSIFQPRLHMEGVPGQVEPGNWYGTEPVARVFNNYMSQGLHGQSAIYNGVRATNNALNTLQLGLSGFHATFVSLDTALSKTALGLQQLSQGKPIKGIGNVLFGSAAMPAAVVQTAIRGGELRRAWLDPESATPQMRKIADAMVAGGGRVSMPEFFRTSASGTFFKHLSDLKSPQSVFYDAAQMFRDASSPVEKSVMVPLRIAGRLLDTLNEPLMGVLVPRAKLGVFADMAQNWLESHPNATAEELSAAMTKFQDSVDNRLGQLNYDNLFWHKVAKDIAFITTRSVGWNLGTVREIGGAFVDSGSAVKAIARGKAPELTTRMAYTIALPVITAQLGAVLTYLATGAPPQSLLDYYYPPTGNGEDRRNIPGYMKDVIDFYHHPLQTVTNKMSPMMSSLAQLARGTDYYGGIIYDPARDRGAVPAYADYLLNQALPFSLRSRNKLAAENAPMMDQALSFWGFQAAPKGITQPERGEHFQQMENRKGYRRRLREPGRLNFFNTPAGESETQP